jgi:hypothetical protein
VNRRTGVGPIHGVGRARSRYQRRRPGYVASWGRGGAFAHRFGDRYRTLRVGEELRVGAVGVRASGPGRPGFKAWLIGGSPY